MTLKSYVQHFLMLQVEYASKQCFLVHSGICVETKLLSKQYHIENGFRTAYTACHHFSLATLFHYNRSLSLSGL